MNDDEAIGFSLGDRSLRMIAALSAEVAVLRERLEIVERIAGERGLFGPEDVDAYRPAPDVAEEIKAKRRVFIRRIFQAMRT